MGKHKSTTTDTKTYGYQPYQETADVKAARDSINDVDFSTPILGEYGRAEGDINNQYFEDNLPEQVRERVKMGQLFNLHQNEGAALANAKGQEAKYKSGNKLALANMTQNPFVQTGGTQTTVTPFDWTSLIGPALGAGATVASAGMAPNAT